MSWNRSLVRKHQMKINRKEKIKLRKHLNADALFATVRSGFEKIQDHRNSNATIPLADVLMSGFAVFSLKDPSLLAFDERRTWCSHNLMTVYNINHLEKLVFMEGCYLLNLDGTGYFSSTKRHSPACN